MDVLGAESRHEDVEEDKETRRLQEDALMDSFKTIEKFLIYWLPLLIENKRVEESEWPSNEDIRRALECI